MKQTFSLGVFIFLLITGINAQSVNKDKIKSAASGFLNQQQEIDINKKPGDIEAEYITLDGEKVASLVNMQDSGFVLMATDKRQKPVIGYSFRNNLNPDKMPPALKNWLKGNNNVTLKNRSEHPEWQKLLSGKNKNRSFPKVPAMVTSVWTQSWPYNAKCPEHPNGSNGHTLVGCVATAMSQIMHYWEYPDSGEGSKTHFWGEYYTVHFDQANYDWAVMDDYINNSNQDEIAKLNYHAAVSVDMNFGPNASGTSTGKVDDALKNHFKYMPTVQFLSRKNYTYDEWKNKMQNEMLSSRPVLYSGKDTTQGGHAFVMDGFRDSSYFHFNWGWGGSANGYFHLNDMANGGGNFFKNQRAVIGIMPPDADFCGNHWMTAPGYEFDDGSGYSLYQNNSSCSYLIEHPDSSASLELQFTNWKLADAGDKVTLYDGKDKNAPVLASFDGTQTPTLLTSSSNKVFIEFETDSSGIDQGWKLKYSSKTTSVERNETDNLQVSPNPVDDVIYVNGAEKGKLALYSIEGQKLLEQKITNSQQSVDVSNLTPGFYMLNVIMETGYRKVQKIIVK